MYGLGKLVKKVTRTVKKIAKSPIGKAALLYTGIGGLGNMAAGQSFFSNFASPSTFLGGASNIFKSGGLRNILVGRPESIISPKGSDIFRQAATKGIFGSGGEFSPLKAFSIASALPLLGIGTGDESEEEDQTEPESGEDQDQTESGEDQDQTEDDEEDQTETESEEEVHSPNTCRRSCKTRCRFPVRS